MAEVGLMAYSKQDLDIAQRVAILEEKAKRIDRHETLIWFLVVVIIVLAVLLGKDYLLSFFPIL